MWVPKHFANREEAWPAELIDAHPFALLVTSAQGAPVATHIPVIIEPADRERAEMGMAGIRLIGHLARENPQWEDSDPRAEALLVFGGPNAYVSPTVYSDAPAAPTWNYTAVHAHGPIRWIHEPEELMRIIDLTIDRTEANEGTGWDREPSRPYFERILHGIVGFEVIVQRSSSTFKLSQDQPPHRRRQVVDAGGAGEESGAGGCPRHGGSELEGWTKRANPEVFGE